MDGGTKYYKDKVTVSAKGGYMGLGGVLSTRMVAQITPLDGVDVVVPGVSMLLSDDVSGVSMGTPLVTSPTPLSIVPVPLSKTAVKARMWLS